ncbi:Uncharacterised protein [uncultured archaeon]|nr:Uncharacterised protein [uncultured archaeon]
MVERKLYLKFYAAMKKHSEAEEWRKFLRVSDRFYEVLFRDQQKSRETSERNSLCKKMDDLILLCQIADKEKERQEEKEDNPYDEISRSMTKMHEAFLAKNWERALALNDLAYGISYELYEKAEGETRRNLSQRLAFLHGYQDLVLTQQLKGSKK